YADAYYNKAICYAFQGQVRSAADNLKQAIEINPKCREEARTDRDFVAIGEDDRFWNLVAGRNGYRSQVG
ncbi:MAG: tetratricopeptide repeat protein, partial [Geitlerinemataceae cyanobacterium]